MTSGERMQLAGAVESIHAHGNGCEAWSVGLHKVLYSAATGGISLANETAMRIWHWLSADGGDAEATVRRMQRVWNLGAGEAQAVLEGQLNTWLAGGLLAEKPVQAPLPTVRAAPRSALHIGCFETPFGLTEVYCEDRFAADVLTRVLSPLAVTGADDRPRQRLDLRGTTERYWVDCDGITLCEPDNIAMARHMALRQLVFDRTRPDKTSAILHAAAVEMADRAVVIAGDCGQGKSTLTACLVSDGAGYLGDDLIPLHRNGRWIEAFPVALSSKVGSWPVVEPLFPRHMWSDEIAINDDRLKYLDLSSRRPQRSRFEIGAIIFPSYRAGAAFHAERVAPEQALALLLEAGARTVGPTPTMEGLCRLADRTPAFELTYGNWRDASGFITAEMVADR